MSKLLLYILFFFGLVTPALPQQENYVLTSPIDTITLNVDFLDNLVLDFSIMGDTLKVIGDRFKFNSNINTYTKDLVLGDQEYTYILNHNTTNNTVLLTIINDLTYTTNTYTGSLTSTIK